MDELRSREGVSFLYITHDAAGPASDTGEPPRVVDPGEGCRFRARCPYAVAECARVTPRLRPMRPGHMAACHVATPDLPTATAADGRTER